MAILLLPRFGDPHMGGYAVTRTKALAKDVMEWAVVVARCHLMHCKGCGYRKPGQDVVVAIVGAIDCRVWSVRHTSNLVLVVATRDGSKGQEVCPCFGCCMCMEYMVLQQSWRDKGVNPLDTQGQPA